jgi:hypothetical protein
MAVVVCWSPEDMKIPQSRNTPLRDRDVLLRKEGNQQLSDLGGRVPLIKR